MDDLQISVIDVGHGSCVLLASGKQAVLVDTGPSSAILEYLEKSSITELDLVVISHADADHIRGLMRLLDNGLPVRRVVVNSDAIKDSDLWRSLLFSLDDRHARGITSTVLGVTRGVKIETGIPGLDLEVVAPRLRMAGLGVGSRTDGGSLVTSNTMSIVCRLSYNSEGLIFIPGDVDLLGWREVSAEADDLTSRYLVLPHHGGLMGTPAETVTAITEVVAAVAPAHVFASNGRVQHGLPRADVVAAVRLGAPHARIACTQLTQACSLLPILQMRPDFISTYSRGASNGHSCAGTIVISAQAGLDQPLNTDVHDRFVSEEVPSPMCRSSR